MLLNIYIQNTACTLYNRVFDVFPFLAMNLVCNWVLVLVRKSHPLATACQDVPVRWPIVCVWLWILCYLVLVLVRVSHPLAAACQDVPSFVRWPIMCVYVIVNLVCYWVLVLVRMSHPSAAACQDVSSHLWPIVCVCVCMWLYVLCVVGSLC